MATANCARTSWLAGILLGLFVWLVTAGIGPLAWFEGLFLAILATVLSARTLIWLTCEGAGGIDATEWQPVSVAMPVQQAVMQPAKAQVAPLQSSRPDDLKELKGVGPKLEAVLHHNGITRFDQIAAWSDADVSHYAEALGSFGSRIRSEDWVGQAKLLAAGGETDHSRAVQKDGAQ